MSSPRKAPTMEPTPWTKQPLSPETRGLVMARGYEVTRTHLGAPTASQPRCAMRHVEGRPAHPQPRSVVWCAEGAANLSATRRCDLLVFGAPTVGDDVALASRDHPQVHLDREFVELSQSFLQQVSP